MSRVDCLTGSIAIPPSKSHSIRAIAFAAMGAGRFSLHGLLSSPDIEAALSAAEALGAHVARRVTDKEGHRYIEATIDGVAGKPCLTTSELDVGNSGQVLRFFGALAALSKEPIVLTGDASITSQRTMQPLLNALQQRGAVAYSLKDNGLAPIYIRGPIQPGKTVFCGRDSQPVSGMLMASSFLSGTSYISAYDSGELPWIALTLSWLNCLGISNTQLSIGRYRVQGLQSLYVPFSYRPPADFSSAAFPTVAALITGSKITLEGLDFTDVQGDRLLFSQLQSMGALIKHHAAERKVEICGDSLLQGASIDVDPMIDALPILAVLGCFAKGETHLVGALSARNKECDRISVMAESLKRLGADIEEKKESLIIRSSKLRAPRDGKPFSSYHDHRIAMALSVAGLATQGEIVIEGVGAIQKSYPTFCRDMISLGARFQEESGGVLRVRGGE